MKFMWKDDCQNSHKDIWANRFFICCHELLIIVQNFHNEDHTENVEDIVDAQRQQNDRDCSPEPSEFDKRSDDEDDGGKNLYDRPKAHDSRWQHCRAINPFHADTQ